MPELPSPNSESTNSSNSVSFNMNVPTVTHLSSSYLLSHGWIVFDKGKWIKNGHVISYDGVSFILDGKTKIDFVEDLTQIPDNK